MENNLTRREFEELEVERMKLDDMKISRDYDLFTQNDDGTYENKNVETLYQHCSTYYDKGYNLGYDEGFDEGHIEGFYDRDETP